MTFHEDVHCGKRTPEPLSRSHLNSMTFPLHFIMALTTFRTLVLRLPRQVTSSYELVNCVGHACQCQTIFYFFFMVVLFFMKSVESEDFVPYNFIFCDQAKNKNILYDEMCVLHFFRWYIISLLVLDMFGPKIVKRSLT